MPLVILIIAVILLVSGLNNKLSPNAANSGQSNLSDLVKQDWAPTDGSISFGVWLLAIGMIGVIGYAKPLKPFSNAFLILVLLAILLKGNSSSNGSNAGGFFANLFAYFNSVSTGKTQPQAISATTANAQSGLGDSIYQQIIAGVQSGASNQVIL